MKSAKPQTVSPKRKSKTSQVFAYSPSQPACPTLILIQKPKAYYSLRFNHNSYSYLPSTAVLFACIAYCSALLPWPFVPVTRFAPLDA